MKFASPQNCEDAFYRSFRENDIDTMRGLWAAHNGIVCVHPGRRPLTGREDVLASWQDILGAPGHFDIRMEALRVVATADLAVHFGLEFIQAGDDPREATISVVNVYEYGNDGWRMRVHHAGPIHEDLAVTQAPMH